MAKPKMFYCVGMGNLCIVNPKEFKVTYKSDVCLTTVW